MIPSDQSDTEYERIARRLSGEMDAVERAQFDREFGESKLLEAASRDWRAAAPTGSVNVDAAWVRLQGRMKSVDRTKVVDIRQRRRNWLSSGAIRSIAAGLVLVAGAGVLLRTRGATEPASLTPASAGTAVERRTIDLADGSRVILSPGSSLKTAAGYGSPDREVELVGEALFTVRHDEEHPFRIRTASALIEDLGTEFTVRAFEREPVRVSVTEGSVKVRRAGADEDRAVVLRPRDMAVLPDSGDLVVSRGVDVETYRAWTRGQLVFRNTAMRDAIREIERWYDLDFRIPADDPLLDRSIDVTFDNQPADEMLRILGTMLGTEFEREGQVVRLPAPVRTGMKSGSPVQVGSGA